jgi:hypothetical protein
MVEGDESVETQQEHPDSPPDHEDGVQGFEPAGDGEITREAEPERRPPERDDRVERGRRSTIRHGEPPSRVVGVVVADGLIVKPSLGVFNSSRFELIGFPLATEQRVQFEVDMSVGMASRLSHRPLVGESETFGDGAAALVVGGGADDGPVEATVFEDVIQKGSAGARDDAVALKIAVNPVSDLAFLAVFVEMDADHPAQRSAIDHPRLDGFVPAELAARSVDEVDAVVDLRVVAYPREPSPEIIATCIDHRKEAIGIGVLEQAQTNVVVDLECKHDGPVACSEGE